jgi:hypothetical protein
MFVMQHAHVRVPLSVEAGAHGASNFLVLEPANPVRVQMRPIQIKLSHNRTPGVVSMFNHSVVAAKFAVILCVSLTLSTTALHARSDSKVRELVAAMGTQRALEDFPATIKSGLKDLPPTAQAKEFSAAAAIAADNAFSTDKLVDGVIRRLEGKLSSDDIEAVLAFYNGPLGKQMVALETAAGTPEGQAEMSSQAAEILKGFEADAPRREVLQSITNALKLEDLMTNMVLSMQRSMAIAMTAGLGKTVTAEQIDADVAKSRPAVAKQMAGYATLSMAYAYRNTKVEDLKAYKEFLTSPIGDRLHAALVPALSGTLTDSSAEFGRQLSENLK